MTAITKTQMVKACADYEVDWLFSQSENEQKEVFRQIMLEGFEGFVNYSNERLFAMCVDKGVFLMEE